MDIELSVSDFIAIFNQSIEQLYPRVIIKGEISNYRISKNRWVYFDLKDDFSCLKVFGTVYSLSTVLDNGMMVKVLGSPRLHNQYGFSLNFQKVEPYGEGSIKKAADLLRQKLLAEGLFDQERKRSLVYPPQHIGLITSKQSAAYSDFIKIINNRWPHVLIDISDVQVQGENAAEEIVSAIEGFNSYAITPEVLVIIRGGGSSEDLAVFSSEKITRAVATSRAPTLVAIGHERDLSLAELAADLRASTPSNAAELLVPDIKIVTSAFLESKKTLKNALSSQIKLASTRGAQVNKDLDAQIEERLSKEIYGLKTASSLIEPYNIKFILNRGFSITRAVNGVVVKHTDDLKVGDIVKVQLAHGKFISKVDIFD